MSDNEDQRSADPRKRGLDLEDDFSDRDDRDSQHARRSNKRPALDEPKHVDPEDDGPHYEYKAPARPAAPAPDTEDLAKPPIAAASTEDGGEIKVQPLASSAPLPMRALVTTKDAGIIIGRGGKNVSDVRERSGARITISEMIPGAQERILTVIGPVDAVAKAFALVARKILEETSTTNSEVTSTSVRLLVPHGRMGSIIGKSGTKIKEIQEQSGARILASENMLPDSTERTVTVSGVPDAIHIATYHIGRILQDQVDTPVHTVLYKPTARAGHPAYGGAGASAATGAGIHPMDPYGAVYAPYTHHTSYASAPTPHRSGAAPGVGQAGVGGASQAQQIFIPNDMVGCIIGRGGCKINEIRQLSGSNIKIAEPHGNAHERLVTITGTPESNQMALYLLYSRLEAEKSRMAAGY